MGVNLCKNFLFIYRQIFIPLIAIFICLIFGLEGAVRGSIAPYISGDTFRSFCDYIYDETGCNFRPEKVKNGDKIFVKVDNLPNFFLRMHPRIRSKYILVSHNGDLPVPANFSHILDDPRLIAWFGQNVENYSHPKLHPIPIGLANLCWAHGNVETVDRSVHSLDGIRDILLYVNLNIETNPSVRRPVYDLFANQPYSFTSLSTSFENYLMDLSRSKFVLSPRGNGLDTHRTWEALYLGAIPIVLSSSLDPLFEDLPVLIINSWSEISEEFLLEKYEEMSRKTYRLERLYADYWFDRLSSYIQ